MMPFSRQYGKLDTEFYTRKSDVLRLAQFLDKGKRYVEPFDRMGRSLIFNELRNLGFDIVNNRDDFDERADFGGRTIITNPPFISRARLFSKMSKMCDEMYLIMTRFTFCAYTKFRHKDKCRRWTDEWTAECLFDVTKFDTNNGTRNVQCVMTHWVKKAKGEQPK